MGVPCRGSAVLTQLLVMFGILSVLWGLTGGSLYLAYDALEDRRLLRDSARWPSTSGVVFYADTRPSLGKSGTSYGASIQYRYSVSGKPFEGHYFSGNHPSTDSARTVALAHPPGSAVTIRYRPDDPSLSFMEGKTWDGELTVVLGVLLGLVFGLLSSAMTGIVLSTLRDAYRASTRRVR